MSNDFRVEEQEDEFNDARERLICRNAAILVVQGVARSDALTKAEAVFEAQQEAENDITGSKGTLAEAQAPQMPNGADAKVATIAQELYESRN